MNNLTLVSLPWRVNGGGLRQEEVYTELANKAVKIKQRVFSTCFRCGGEKETAKSALRSFSLWKSKLLFNTLHILNKAATNAAVPLLCVSYLTPSIITRSPVWAQSVWCCQWRNLPSALWIDLSVINSAKWPNIIILEAMAYLNMSGIIAFPPSVCRSW